MLNISSLEKRLSWFINIGDMNSARLVCKEILLQEKSHHYSLFLLGMVEFKQKSYSKAVQYFENAVISAPEIVIYQVNFIKCLINLGRLNKAIQVAQSIKWREIEDFNVLNVVGQIFSSFEMHEKAEILFTKALQIEPDNSSVLFSLATTQKYLAKFEKAERNLEEVVNKEPLYGPAHYAIATFAVEQNADERIQRLLQVCDSTEQHYFSRVQIYFALYLEYEKIKNYKRAFECLEFANKLHFDNINYNPKNVNNLFRSIQQSFDLQGLCENQSDEVIFVLGMPRNGTTLMERILASHSQIDSVGEINYFNSGVYTDGQELLQGDDGKVNVNTFKQEQFSKVGNDYLQAIIKEDSSFKYYVDKSLTNYLYLGYILKSLPKSRVVFMKRNRVDSCFSNFRQLFAQHTNKYDFSYNLEATIEYQSEFEDLMKYWKKVFPENIMTIQYEELVSDFNNQVNKVLEFCNVKFENSCIEFHNNRSASSTASFAQVRQPVSDKFIARWKHYESYLLNDEAFATMILNTDGISA